MSITTNLQHIRASVPQSVRLVCVSKFQPNTAILEAYQAGERLFGESRVQELVAKHETLPQDICWHFIGHLQTNKVKYIAPFVSLVHAVDSYKLLVEIDREAQKCGRIIDILLQVHIAGESTKFGFFPAELMDFLLQEQWADLQNIRIRGLMGMATFTDDEAQVRNEFHLLKTVFDKVKRTFFAACNSFDTLSMGMSDDYQIAMNEGSTMLRIGTGIFGER
ncbi:MAG: YggS family pyridoxal phosphate-dependent enzyme [Prevotellaceae bacterium]|jgi:pyridoxal phosphate enzyme (YggS family)|nr:YggS family pyridoxal phosphate-dependent enzyme [Prevotellaceae bacterium]